MASVQSVPVACTQTPTQSLKACRIRVGKARVSRRQDMDLHRKNDCEKMGNSMKTEASRTDRAPAGYRLSDKLAFTTATGEEQIPVEKMPGGMSTCETCGNHYDKCFRVILDGKEHTFDCFECAIQLLAPACAHCGCTIIGHGLERVEQLYCCDHCARQRDSSSHESSEN